MIDTNNDNVLVRMHPDTATAMPLGMAVKSKGVTSDTSSGDYQLNNWQASERQNEASLITEIAALI